MSKKPIRVGFDLDGVILYNPARIVRPIVKFIKKRILRQTDVTTFYIPKTRLERALWHIFHYSSIIVAPGFDQIRELTEAGIIEPYLVTARYSFLEKDLRSWLKRLQVDTFFQGVYFNELDEQPHLYKERIITALQLDYFVEDNYDIVKHLEQSAQTKIIWIYNIFDRKLSTTIQVPNLSQAVSHIKPRKNILVYSEFYAPHWTGIVKACEQMVADLTRLGHAVTVITTKLHPSSKSHEHKSGVTIVRFPYLLKLSRTLYSPSTLWGSLRQLKRADSVIINSPHSNILFLSILATLLGKRLVIFHQGDLVLPRMTGNQLLNRFVERTFDFMTLSSMALADTISTYTQDYAQHSRVMKLFLRKFVPYIPTVQMSQKSPTKDFRDKMQALKKDSLLLGVAGRFVEEKGFDILLNALPIIRKEFPSARIVFAGEMSMEYERFSSLFAETILKLEKERVFIPLGLLQEAELAHFYTNLDCFVLSSRSDCFALTQAEAALHGTPIVCTNIPGARMLVKKSGFGELVQSENPTSLAHGIRSVLKHRSTYVTKAPSAQGFLTSYAEPPF